MGTCDFSSPSTVCWDNMSWFEVLLDIAALDSFFNNKDTSWDMTLCCETQWRAGWWAKKTKVPINAQRHHKQRLRHSEEKRGRQKQLAEEFVINLPNCRRPKREQQPNRTAYDYSQYVLMVSCQGGPGEQICMHRCWLLTWLSKTLSLKSTCKYITLQRKKRVVK